MSAWTIIGVIAILAAWGAFTLWLVRVLERPAPRWLARLTLWIKGDRCPTCGGDGSVYASTEGWPERTVAVLVDCRHCHGTGRRA